MASLIYNGTTSQTTTYAATDIYTLAIPTSSITNVSQQGNNVVIQTGATSLTIAGVTLAQLANGNFAVQGGGFVQFGDGTADTVADAFGNVIAQGANNNGGLVLGLGGGDTITLGNGANLVYGGSGVTDPTDGGDTITTGTGNDTIYGNGGNDSITSGGGTDIVFGGIGLDTITTGALTGNTSVYGGGGFTDTTDGADSITIASNAGSLFVTGNAGNDTITLQASTGSASVYGGIGADTLNVTASAGNNLVAGGSSAGTSADVDTINFNASGTANATIYGGVGITDSVDGADSITAAGFLAGSNAFIYGNAGNDTISVGTAGNASVYGGVGNDLITLTAGAASGRVQVFAGPSDAGGVDTVDGSLFLGNATIFGGNGLNDSADGADRLLGGAGNDVIYGNGGNDTIFSGAGNDQLSGGAGSDVFVINGAGNKAITDFGTGTDSIFLGTAVGAVNGVSVSGSTLLIDGVNTDISVSGTVPTTFVATFDADNNGVAAATEGQLIVATTSTGASLVGTGNDDLIIGNAGGDNIVGGVGVDTIIGGAGVDTLSGGVENDIFRFRVNGESGTTGVNVAPTAIDRIIDANVGDVIDFDSSSDAAATNDAAVAANAANAFAGGVVTGNLATNVAAATTFAAALDLVEAALGANAVAGFNYAGNAYIVHNDGTANNDVIDNVIQLTGATITAVAEVGTSDTFTFTI